MNRHVRWRRVGAIAATGLAAVLVATGAQPFAAADERPTILGGGTPETVPDSFIVVLKPAAATTPAAVPGVAGTLARRYGGSARRTFGHALRGFEAQMSEAAAQRLAADPAVAYVQRNVVLHASGAQPNPPSWGLNRIDQVGPVGGFSNYTYRSTGSRVHAYVIDTGIRFTHTDFGGRATSGIDTVDNDADATDCAGHGTHVAGTIGGSTYGVAKGVSLVAVRVLNCSGNGTLAQVIAGVDWVTAHAVKPAVANMSLGGAAVLALDDAVRNSIASGITYGIAAGNGDQVGNPLDACTASPARVATAITVSATDSTDTKASWANYGSCVDIFAPGVSITSAWNGSDTQSTTISGTSMATPHVAGAAALVLAEHPQYTPQQVRDALVNRATTGLVQSPGSGSPNRLLRARADHRADRNGDGQDDDVAVGRTPSNEYVVAAHCASTYWSAWTAPGTGAPPIALAAGDFNRDGMDDYAFGAVRTVDGGLVDLYYGSPTCSGSHVQISQSTANVPGTGEADDQFGAALAAGDINRDGYDDLVVGAPGEDVGTVVDAGGITVLYGAPSGLTGTGSVGLTQNSSGVPGTAEASDRFGSALAIGDVTGDGYADLAVAATGENSPAGAVTLLNGSASGITTTGATLVTGGWANNSTVELRELGTALAIADTTGDGLGEVLAGAPGSLVNGSPSAGAVVSYLGRPAGLSTTGRLVRTQDSSGVPGTAETGDRFGASVAAGDVTGDERADVIIGSPGESVDAAIECGSITVLPGSASGLTGAGSVSFTQNSAGVPDTNESGDHLGYQIWLRVAGTSAGSGLAALVSAPGERFDSDGTFPSGQVTTFLNSGSGLVPGTAATGGFGYTDWGTALPSA